MGGRTGRDGLRGATFSSATMDATTGDVAGASVQIGDPITEKLIGVSAIDDKLAYFEASPLSYVSGRDNGTAFLVVWGTMDDIVDCKSQSEAFLEALKQARFFARPVILPGAPHFWMADPIEESHSHSGFLAPRLLRRAAPRLRVLGHSEIPDTHSIRIGSIIGANA